MGGDQVGRGWLSWSSALSAPANVPFHVHLTCLIPSQHTTLLKQYPGLLDSAHWDTFSVLETTKAVLSSITMRHCVYV